MSLVKLQEHCGVNPDGVFGKTTFNAAKAHFNLTPIRAVHFFAQTAHETGGFRLFEESLNYSADRLLKVFPNYFRSNAMALAYARKPEKIANRVYANRMGNGDEQSGDGWKYRGRGAIQLTGKFNYQTFSEHIKNEEIVDNPGIVAEQFSFESAMFFFDRNNLWRIADRGLDDKTITQLSLRINGGYNGLSDRIKLTTKYKAYI